MQDVPLISLVIPAWNEEALLPRLLDSVDRARSTFVEGPERLEVIVADNASSDATAEIARTRGCIVASVERRCIASSRNGGAALARGDILAFADADFVLHPESFNFIAQAMRTPGVIGGATGLVMERWSLGIRVTWYLILPPLWAFGLDGGVWFCRTSDFRLLGGYNEEVKAGEDVRFLWSLRRLGRSRSPQERLLTRFNAPRLGLQPPLVTNSTRKFDKYGDWHMLRDALRLLPTVLVTRAAVDRHIERYFYRDRERSKG